MKNHQVMCLFLLLIGALPACNRDSNNTQNTVGNNRPPPPFQILHIMRGEFRVVSVFRNGTLSPNDKDVGCIFKFDDDKISVLIDDESYAGTLTPTSSHRRGIVSVTDNGYLLSALLSVYGQRNRNFLFETFEFEPEQDCELIGFIPDETSLPPESLEACAETGVIYVLHRTAE